MLAITVTGMLAMTANGGALPAEDSFSGLVSEFGQLKVAFLLLAGAGMAMITMHTVKVRQVPKPAPSGQLSDLGDLLAQLSHELRTPLNAVIGFSDVMRQELHGPIGNARYQEYVHHIAESGGRMLRSSQVALSTAEAMAALLDRDRSVVRERMTAATMLRDAAQTIGLAPEGLEITGCATCEVVCERRATTQALEHLLREAARHTGPGGKIKVSGRRNGSRRSIEIAAAADEGSVLVQAHSLHVLLARLLIEAQGGHLHVARTSAPGWTVSATFEVATAARD